MKITKTNRSEDKKPALTEKQVGAIRYFYAKLPLIYPERFNAIYPDKESVRASAREFGKYICDIPPDKMDAGFAALHELLQDPQSPYSFMPMDAIIELLRTGGKGSESQALYKPFRTELGVSDEVKEKRKVAGASALDDMKKLFD